MATSSFCPRCDAEFAGEDKAQSDNAVREHIKRGIDDPSAAPGEAIHDLALLEAWDEMPTGGH